jgi:hypothetical protein
MKNKLLFVILLLTSSISFGQAKDLEFLPPFNFQVDSTTLLATWEAPKIVLLDEDFEGETFPPAGWDASSLGKGWMRDNDPFFRFWSFPVPPGYFALTNDDSAFSNNGSLDYLVTPSLDLTVADSFYMVFDSYFDGGYGEQAFIEYSLDNGNTWLLLHQMEASLEWENVRVDLSALSGTEGTSNILIAFHADDNGYFASGWAIDNVVISTDQNPNEVLYYKMLLDSGTVHQASGHFYKYSFGYKTTHLCGILAKYSGGVSDTVWQTVHSVCLPKPNSLSGTAPDDSVLLFWMPPLINYNGPATEMNRDVGDEILSWPAPSPISLCWGICDDGEKLWITDPNLSSTSIYGVTYEGVFTGDIITVSMGQIFIADMVSDGQYLYACLVGGPNTIVKVDLATGVIVGTISGDWTFESQRGLAADFCNEEFYLGGWYSDQIWRIDFEGNTISTYVFGNVCGLAWHPTGGPEAEGSLWVIVNDDTCLVTEIDPNNNWATIQSFVMPDDQGQSGAGLEIKISEPDAGACWIPNQSNNTIYLVDLGENLPAPPAWHVPDNLLGFNLYRNGEFRGYSAYSGGQYAFFEEPADFSESTFFEYEVSALYDMGPYGFPSDTGESLREGPAGIYSCCSDEMDYFEDWSPYTYNYWKMSGNWQIDPGFGNEAPSAVFNPDSILLNYRDSLQTYLIMAYGMTADILLSWDISFSGINPTGNETMRVQVYDVYNDEWNTVMTYDNTSEGFDWRQDTINISDVFNDGSFRIRFFAEGDNSSDVDYWAVDNISARYIGPPPTNVDANLGPDSSPPVFITWDAPESWISEWRQWDDGEQYTSIGAATMKDQWLACAIRWTPDQLADLKGADLTAIGFIPGDLTAFYKIAVWKDDNYDPFYIQAAGNLIVDQWNIITLEEPIPVDITKSLLVGYQFAGDDSYAIALDNGPAVDGYGNLIQSGPHYWQTILQVTGLDYNVNLKAYFERDGVPIETYNLYRSVDGSEPVLIAEPTQTYYIDTAGIGLCCYNVTSVFYNGSESGFSNQACVLLTEIPDIVNVDMGTLRIYPNPASDVLFIESSETIEFVTLYDGRGERVKRRKGEGVKMGIQVNDLAPGLYMVKINLGDEIISRKIIVKH